MPLSFYNQVVKDKSQAIKNNFHCIIHVIDPSTRLSNKKKSSEWWFNIPSSSFTVDANTNVDFSIPPYVYIHRYPHK